MVYFPLKELKIIFMGTAELSCVSLEKLACDKNSQIAAIVTQPDKPKGRELKLPPSPVKILADKLKLPVLPASFSKHAMKNSSANCASIKARLNDCLCSLRTDFAADAFAPDLPRFGCLNVRYIAAAPKYRRRCMPIQWAIADGELETGVTIMKMDAGLDTGPILSTRHTPIHYRTDDSQNPP